MRLIKNKLFLFYFFIASLAFFSGCHSGKETSKTSDGERINSSRSKKIQSKYSGLLKVDDSKIENIKLYAFIDEWYGTPYKYGGKNKQGIDCSNFTSTIYK